MAPKKAVKKAGSNKAGISKAGSNKAGSNKKPSKPTTAAKSKKNDPTVKKKDKVKIEFFLCRHELTQVHRNK
jgi:hypothetical protein